MSHRTDAFASKTVIYLGCSLAVVVVASQVFGELTKEMFLLALTVCAVVDGFLEGRFALGLRGLNVTAHREKSPIAYWCTAAFNVGLLALLLWIVWRQAKPPSR